MYRSKTSLKDADEAKAKSWPTHLSWRLVAIAVVQIAVVWWISRPYALRYPWPGSWAPFDTVAAITLSAAATSFALSGIAFFVQLRDLPRLSCMIIVCLVAIPLGFFIAPDGYEARLYQFYWPVTLTVVAFVVLWAAGCSVLLTRYLERQFLDRRFQFNLAQLLIFTFIASMFAWVAAAVLR